MLFSFFQTIVEESSSVESLRAAAAGASRLGSAPLGSARLPPGWAVGTGARAALVSSHRPRHTSVGGSRVGVGAFIRADCLAAPQ